MIAQDYANSLKCLAILRQTLTLSFAWTRAETRPRDSTVIPWHGAPVRRAGSEQG
jgi:hypothetical protein